MDGDFEPKIYHNPWKGVKYSLSFAREAKKADKIYLATDPDREGEAISWHLLHALKLEGKDVSRISFNEITKNAVKESLKAPKKKNRYGSCRCTAGQTSFGPYCRLQNQSAALGQGQERGLVREEYSLLRFVSSVTGRMKSMLLSLRSTGALMPRLDGRVRRSQSLQSYTAGRQ